MIPNIEKVILLKLDENTLTAYTHLDDSVLSGYTVNLTITQGGQDTVYTGGIKIENIVVTEDTFDISINYSYTENHISNSVQRSGLDRGDINIAEAIDLSGGLIFRYTKDNSILVSNLGAIDITFPNSNVAVETDDNTFLVSGSSFQLPEGTNEIVLVLYLDDIVNNDIGIATICSHININNVIDVPHWEELIYDQINIPGFDIISYDSITQIFNRIKREINFEILKSNYNDYKWIIDAAHNYILDIHNYRVVDSSKSIISSFINYNNDDHSFIIDVNLTGRFILIGEWANRYNLLAELWNLRVESRVRYVNTNIRGVSARLQQEFDHCVKMRDYYRGLTIKRLSW